MFWLAAHKNTKFTKTYQHHKNTKEQTRQKTKHEESTNHNDYLYVQINSIAFWNLTNIVQLNALSNFQSIIV